MDNQDYWNGFRDGFQGKSHTHYDYEGFSDGIEHMRKIKQIAEIEDPGYIVSDIIVNKIMKKSVESYYKNLMEKNYA